MEGQDSSKALLSLASAGNFEELISLLEQLSDTERRQAVIRQDANNKTLLHYACGSGNLNCVSYLMAHGGDSTIRDTKGQTPFFDAVRRNQIILVVHLLNTFRFDPNVEDKANETPLLWAVRHGKTDLVRALVLDPSFLSSQPDLPSSQGRKINIEQKGKGSFKGRTALHTAAAGGREDVVQILLDNGAKLDVVDEERKTPLFSAVKYDRMDIVKLFCSMIPLQDRRGGLMWKDCHGRTALHLACASGHLDIVEYFLSLNNMLLELPDNYGQTCAFSAARYQQPAVLRFLVQQKNANINARDRKGRTPLHSAAAGGHVDIIELLLDMGAVQNLQDDLGQTALFSAVHFKKTDAIECLLKRDADVTIRDLSGSCVLHYAAKLGESQDVKLLLSAPNIEVESRDNIGYTALDLAVRDDVKELLQTHSTADPVSKKRKADVLDKPFITEGSSAMPPPFTAKTPLPSPPKKSKPGLTKGPHDPLDLSTIPYTLQQPHNKTAPAESSNEESYNLSRSLSFGTAEIHNSEDNNNNNNNNTLKNSMKKSGEKKKQKGSDEEENEENEANEDGDCPATTKLVPSQVTSLRSISGGSVQIEGSEILKLWEIKPEELSFGERLGAGAFGSVWKGTWRGSQVAIKTLHKTDDTAIKMFFKEVSLMCKLRHANIVQYYGVCMQPSQRCLVMEFVPESLSALIRQGPLDMSLLVLIAKGIALGMNYLHCSNVIHRDLKPSNILLDNNWTPKLCDFGVSRESDATATMTGLGTPLYMAPEMFQTRHYGPKIDVYAFAMVLWQMYTGKKLLSGFGFHKNDVTAIQVALQVCMKKLRPDLTEGTPPALAALIRSCWEDTPENRPTFAKVVEALNELTS